MKGVNDRENHRKDEKPTKEHKLHEIKKVLEHNEYKEIRNRGSHHHFRNEQGLITTIMRENPVDIQAVKDGLAYCICICMYFRFSDF